MADKDNVIGIGKNKRTWSQFTIQIIFLDGTEEEQKCSFFGSSYDFPEFMMFLDGDPEKDGQYPSQLIQASQIKIIRLLNVEEVTE